VFHQVYSNTSPFHQTVAALKAAGATVLSQTYMTNLWSQGLADYGLGRSAAIPVYVAQSSDPVKTIHCTEAWGTCVGEGSSIHVPSYVIPQNGSDAHIIVIDPTNNIEWDGWMCSNGSQMSCHWGGSFSLGSKGISNIGSGGVHAGFAVGLFFLTPQELLNGSINHALGMNSECLNNPTVYPADTSTGGTDQACPGGGSNPPHYGNLMHLLSTSNEASAYASASSYCKTIMTALMTYGAYLYDTGNGGLEIGAVSGYEYTAQSMTDPWTAINAAMSAAGDNATCLNKLQASDFELLAIPNSGY
jgi:hypothetical protein